MTTTEPTERRARITYEPLPGHKPWRAVLIDPATRERREPVGRFDDPAEAATAGVSAMRFVAAGVRWVPVNEGEVPA